MAREVLESVGYDSEATQEIFKEIIEPHSCYPDNMPRTLEGKVLATADALAHLSGPFYLHLGWMHIPAGKNFAEFLEWVKAKLQRDFNDKIFFDEVREEMRERYEAWGVVLGSVA